MRIKHVSDTHGHFFKLNGYYDLVVHSGDMSPNFGYASDEASKQMFWWEEKIPVVKEWLEGRPFLFILGNHDFFPAFWLEDLFRSNGINAFVLNDKITTFDGINFYGLPYVPPICGKYAFESTTEQMDDHLDRMVKAMNSTYVDILVAHCPPHSYLDYDPPQNKRFGNTQLNTFLDLKLDKNMHPEYILCGHLHLSPGIMKRGNITIVNSALTQHIIEI